MILTSMVSDPTTGKLDPVSWTANLFPPLIVGFFQSSKHVISMICYSPIGTFLLLNNSSILFRRFLGVQDPGINVII
jgi:hypothetical protein